MKLFQTILSFFLALAQLILAQDPSCPPRHSNEALISKTDMILKGHVRRTLEKITFIQCSLRCLKEDWCFSVNFEIQKRMGKCELNDYGVEDETSVSIEKGEFEEKEGFVYTQLRPAGISACYQNRCQNGGTCTLECAGLSPKCHCAFGFKGDRCEVDINECSSNPCQNGGTCADLVNGFSCTCAAGYNGTRCENNIDECSSNPCENDGTCTDQVNGYSCTCVAGYNGTRCENNIDECSSNPCLHGGTCADQVNGYSCTCVAGYNGTTCEININECSSNPCQNDGTCTDLVNGYSCTCAAGFNETRCEINIDECSSNPCQNGGNCTDQVNGFSCTCAERYNGTRCEVFVGADCDLYFPSASINNLVHANWSTSSDISKLTISYWIKVPSSYTDNVYPFSYATLSEIDSLNFKIKTSGDAGVKIMGSSIRTLSIGVVRDDTWQHCCLTWDRLDLRNPGKVLGYLNGVQTDSYIGLSSDKALLSGGKLIIGQKQGSYGGTFSDTKLVVGYLADLNIWSSVFSAKEVNNLYNMGCAGNMSGNIVSWSDIIQGQLEGSTTRSCPTTCSSG